MDNGPADSIADSNADSTADSPVSRTVSQYRRHLPFEQPAEPAGLVQLRGAVDGAVVQPGRHLGLGLQSCVSAGSSVAKPRCTGGCHARIRMCSTGLATIVLATPAIAPEAYSSAGISTCLLQRCGGKSRFSRRRTEVELPPGGALREEPLGPFERAKLDRDARADAQQRRQRALPVSLTSHAMDGSPCRTPSARPP